MRDTLTETAEPVDRAQASVDRELERNPWVVTVGRAGWVAKGAVYLVFGYIALRVALDGGGSGGSGGGEDEGASPAGALQQLAESTGGTVLMWAIAAGLALFSLWRLVSAVLPGEEGPKAALQRAAFVASALVYLGLAWTAVTLAVGDASDASGSGQSESRIDRTTRTLMENTAGRWLVGAVGLFLAGLGAYFVVKGARKWFTDRLERRDVGPVSFPALVRLGQVGWIARGVTLGLVALFVVRAAVQFDPEEAEGLDGALRRVADSAIGQWLVVVTGVGLAVYGLYCVLSAPRQRLTGPTG